MLSTLVKKRRRYDIVRSIVYALLIPFLIFGCGSTERSQEQKTQKARKADWHKDFGEFLPEANAVLEKINTKVVAMSEGQSKEMAHNNRRGYDNILNEQFGLDKERVEWQLTYHGMDRKAENGTYPLSFDLPGYDNSGDRTKTHSVIISFSTKSPDLWRDIDKGSKVHVSGRLISFVFYVSPADQKPDISNERRVALFSVEDCVPQGPPSSKPAGNMDSGSPMLSR